MLKYKHLYTLNNNEECEVRFSLPYNKRFGAKEKNRLKFMKKRANEKLLICEEAMNTLRAVYIKKLTVVKVYTENEALNILNSESLICLAN